jgi:hypothetical protein
MNFFLALNHHKKAFELYRVSQHGVVLPFSQRLMVIKPMLKFVKHSEVSFSIFTL